MSGQTKPFAAFEWMIAWRYIRARKAEGGVSLMSLISLVGIALAVFALIVVLSVRAGFRAEFVDTILGSNAHVTVYQRTEINGSGHFSRLITDYETLSAELLALPGVTRAAPLVRAQIMANLRNANAGVEVFGIAHEDLLTIPRIANPEQSQGDIARFDQGIAIGSGVARTLGVIPGARIRLISPNGARTPMGTSPRTGVYEVVYIFTAGRYDIDRTRIYMPLAEAQLFFNRDGVADEIEVFVEDPDQIEEHLADIAAVAGPSGQLWTWRDSAGAFLRALTIEDNVMFVIMSILVLIASMNIISGLIMLVKNKGRDIGILRTMGLSQGSIMRIFFICGAGLGTLGTVLGVIMGCAFAIWIDPIFSFVNYIAGGGIWDPSIRGIYKLPAKLQLNDVLAAVSLSLFLSWVITLFPARRAAKMNPVEALRYE